MAAKPLVILIHEIYGKNAYMKKIARLVRNAGFDVITPNLLGEREVYGLEEEKTAYDRFVKNRRLEKGEEIIRRLIMEAHEESRVVYLLGFSMGAAIAWICSSMKEVSGAVCYYGSRIRQYPDIEPACPTLLFFPSFEPSFDLPQYIEGIKEKQHPFIRIYQFEGRHGFANPDSVYFNKQLFLKTLSVIADEAALNDGRI
ncbi:dienelactone hydrolase family protein [Bacillus nakamurai]|uniref:dienelactone hydrolase family protein n=1 Tax=Bacillus nakamurai TaxID=1793963 RepID=UPI001E29C4AE|nr:dienelactone hydrolase family protein [Bacillus nakamurai]MCC9023408.1 dienelactone hydrolase family protein [Bacillus nakamurai]